MSLKIKAIPLQSRSRTVTMGTQHQCDCSLSCQDRIGMRVPWLPVVRAPVQKPWCLGLGLLPALVRGSCSPSLPFTDLDVLYKDLSPGTLSGTLVSQPPGLTAGPPTHLCLCPGLLKPNVVAASL